MQQETTTAQLAAMILPREVKTQRQKLKRKVGHEDKEEQVTREKLRRMQIDSDRDMSSTLQDLD